MAATAGVDSAAELAGDAAMDEAAGSEGVAPNFSSSASILSCSAQRFALGFQFRPLLLHQTAKVLHFALDGGDLRLHLEG